MRRSILVVLVLLLAGTFSVTGADGAPLLELSKACEGAGDNEVDQSMKLANDLEACDKGGLVITKSGITLDLNDHFITGDGSDPEFDAAGVTIADGVKNVTILNGFIETMYHGVYANDTAGSTVRDVFIKGMTFTGVSLVTSSGDVGRKPNVVKNATVIGPSQNGIIVSGFASTVSDSNVTDTASDAAIRVDASRATVTGNDVSDHANAGIDVDAKTSKVVNNTVVDSKIDGYGIDVSSYRADIRSNDVFRLDGTGFTIESNPGPGTPKATVIDNRATNVGDAFSIEDPPALKLVAKKNRSLNSGPCDPVNACVPESTLPDLPDDLPCGGEVEFSGRLTENVGTCAGPGLVILKPNIVLDLNGFQIQGDGEDTDPNPGVADAGVALGPLAKNVTVRNGEIKEFEVGVKSDPVGVNGTKVIDMLFRDMVADTSGSDGHATDLTGNGVLVSRSLVDSNRGSGFQVTGTVAKILNSIVIRTGSENGHYGIDLTGDKASIKGNLILETREGIRADGTKNVISKNDAALSDNGQGFLIDGVKPVITNNDAYGNPLEGIQLQGDGALTVIGNDTHDNGAPGIDAGGRTPIKAKNNHAFSNLADCEPDTIC